MDELLSRFFFRPMEMFADKIMTFLPNLFTALLILVIGSVIALLVKVVLKKLTALVKFDGLAERTGLKGILARSGIHEPISLLLSRLIAGLVLFVFFLAALNSLELGIVQDLVERLLVYLPRIFMALMVLALGCILGNFFGRAALIAAVNSGSGLAGIIGRGVKYFIITLSITMALEMLGFGRDTVLITFAILFSGVVLALAIAFGLGGKDAAREFIEKRLRKSAEDDDVHHL